MSSDKKSSKSDDEVMSPVESKTDSLSKKNKEEQNLEEESGKVDRDQLAMLCKAMTLPLSLYNGLIHKRINTILQRTPIHLLGDNDAALDRVGTASQNAQILITMVWKFKNDRNILIELVNALEDLIKNPAVEKQFLEDFPSSDFLHYIISRVLTYADGLNVPALSTEVSLESIGFPGQKRTRSFMKVFVALWAYFLRATPGQKKRGVASCYCRQEFVEIIKKLAAKDVLQLIPDIIEAKDEEGDTPKKLTDCVIEQIHLPNPESSTTTGEKLVTVQTCKKTFFVEAKELAEYNEMLRECVRLRKEYLPELDNITSKEFKKSSSKLSKEKKEGQCFLLVPNKQMSDEDTAELSAEIKKNHGDGWTAESIFIHPQPYCKKKEDVSEGKTLIFLKKKNPASGSSSYMLVESSTGRVLMKTVSIKVKANESLVEDLTFEAKTPSSLFSVAVTTPKKLLNESTIEALGLLSSTQKVNLRKIEPKKGDTASSTKGEKSGPPVKNNAEQAVQENMFLLCAGLSAAKKAPVYRASLSLKVGIKNEFVKQAKSQQQQHQQQEVENEEDETSTSSKDEKKGKKKSAPEKKKKKAQPLVRKLFSFEISAGDAILFYDTVTDEAKKAQDVEAVIHAHDFLVWSVSPVSGDVNQALIISGTRDQVNSEEKKKSRKKSATPAKKTASSSEKKKTVTSKKMSSQEHEEEEEEEEEPEEDNDENEEEEEEEKKSKKKTVTKVHQTSKKVADREEENEENKEKPVKKTKVAAAAPKPKPNQETKKRKLEEDKKAKKKVVDDEEDKKAKKKVVDDEEDDEESQQYKTKNKNKSKKEEPEEIEENDEEEPAKKKQKIVPKKPSPVVEEDE